MNAIYYFVPFLLAVIVAGSSGMLFEVNGPWYQGLTAPSFRPPSWLFAPVWSAIYLLLAIVGTRLALAAAAGAAPLAVLALALWTLQIVLNTLWTPVFFGAHDLAAAMVIIAALWLAIAALMAVTWRFDALSTAMLVPYILWISFASLLNLRYWMLN